MATSTLPPRADRPWGTFAANGEVIDVPESVRELDSFLRWRTTADLPEEVQICYLDGTIWVDLDLEEFYTHNQVKFEFTRVLGNVVVDGQLGRFVPDRMLMANDRANLSCEPDCGFLAHATVDAGRVTFAKGKKGSALVMKGTPDMVLEVVGRNSIKKDTVLLRDQYWRAGVPEFWLVDARGDELRFDILKRAANGYAAARKQVGWVKSAVFGRSFRLTQTADRRGEPEFALDVR